MTDIFVDSLLTVFNILDPVSSSLPCPSPDEADAAAAQEEKDQADDDQEDDQPPPARLVRVDRGRHVQLVHGGPDGALVRTNVRLGQVLDHEAFVVEDESGGRKKKPLID